MKSLLSMTTWFIVSIAAIHHGLLPLGYSLFSLAIFQGALAPLVDPIQYVFGVAGLISLIMCVRHCTSSECSGC